MINTHIFAEILPSLLKHLNLGQGILALKMAILPPTIMLLQWKMLQNSDVSVVFLGNFHPVQPLNQSYKGTFQREKTPQPDIPSLKLT